jgi:hypothetical protein
MGRRPPPPVDTKRHLKLSKIWNEEIWNPGDEAFLPADFPMDGPHWEDYIPDEAARVATQRRNAPRLAPEEQEAQDRYEAEAAQAEAEHEEEEQRTEDEYAKQNDVLALGKSSNAPKPKPGSRRMVNTPLHPVTDDDASG